MFPFPVHCTLICLIWRRGTICSTVNFSTNQNVYTSLCKFAEFLNTKIRQVNWVLQKRFYNIETKSFIRISPLAENLSSLSWLVEALEFKKGLIIWRERGVWKIFVVFHDSTQQFFLYCKISFGITLHLCLAVYCCGLV